MRRALPIASATLALLALVALTRIGSFTEPFMEFDESIYLLMAREVAHGHLPYLTLFDAKPPGLFFVYGAFVRALGATVYALRFVGALAVLATCAGIVAFARAFASDRIAVACVGACAYAGIAATSMGLAANAELMYTPLVVWAFVPIARAVGTRSALSIRTAFFVGCALGIAVQLKLTALGAAAFGIAFVLFATQRGARALPALLAGIVVPTVLTIVPYVVTRHVAAYLDANVFAYVRRIGNAPHERASVLRAVWGAFKAFLPVPLLVLALPAAIGSASVRERRLVAWLCAWLAFDLVQVVAEREFYAHQFLDAAAPAAILGAWAAVRALHRVVPARTFGFATAAVAAVAVVWHALPADARALAQLRGADRDDRDAVVAYLAANLGTRTLYVSDEQAQLVYPMFGRPLPSRSAPFDFNAPLERLAGADGAADIARSFARMPDVIVSGNDADEDAGVRATIANGLRRYRRAFCAGEHCVDERLP